MTSNGCAKRMVYSSRDWQAGSIRPGRYCRAAARANKDCIILSPRVIHPAVSLLFLLGLAATASTARGMVPAPPTTPSPAARPLILSSCELEDPSGIGAVAAECGDLAVLENPTDPRGRRIKLRVARVAAINRRKQPDPLFVLAGGPGMAATVFYASAAFAFERIHRDRDIVLIDQRGTGRSNPLDCALDDDVLYRATDAEVVDEARRCLAALSSKANVAYYTTSIAVQDLDHVRAALGYELINLYGVSYGTRVAQHYMRRFPERTRSVILDGVVPPQLALGPAIALNAEAALTRVLARCATESDCQSRFADPAAAYRLLRHSLQANPVSVSLPDPTGGQPTTFQFSSYHLATVLRLATYTSEQAALLPLMLHRASVSGDFTPLAAQFLLVNRTYGNALAYGMHNSVVCSEDVPFYDLTTVNRAEIDKTYLGSSQLDGLRNICAIWPHGPIDRDFHAPLHSGIPVLLLSGSDDPVTPPADAELARRGLTHSLHLILRGFGHGQLTAPCISGLMAKFVGRAAVAGLDVSCARDDRPMPFFISYGGPPP